MTDEAADGIGGLREGQIVSRDLGLMIQPLRVLAMQDVFPAATDAVEVVGRRHVLDERHDRGLELCAGRLGVPVRADGRDDPRHEIAERGDVAFAADGEHVGGDDVGECAHDDVAHRARTGAYSGLVLGHDGFLMA